ncbi:Fe(3+) ions import ATP-binding protein FbpC [Magnetospirillum sp. LM-5]|uniref:ABC transporter ATP-binding protein n=1 Tax=Magnetospirillum sp. LM-5 TaxID=2681466 RepID=UPI0013840CA9|nr:ABC transporter ATP-binding protein [Magnetospirillum sp. LM-5]CAA7613989.1 Fe(3+) ions import ATP-binding protein FbpC [Magnetospirillum sp. LM-5]
MTEGTAETCPAGLYLDAISHSYGAQPVVQGVTLAVPPGQLVCLLGPSGCGKTTTLRIAAGLERPSRGRVLLNCQTVSGDGLHLPPEARNVGFLFQDYALFPHLNVAANVAFGLDKMARAERAQRVVEMLRQVGMESYAEAWPHQLSGGQQQRVALARALAPRPRLMLLDEPFSGLDKRLRDQVRDETLHVLKSSGVSTLMVTHDPEEAMFMADSIALMKDGRVVQMGTPEELYLNPETPFVASFFGEVNLIPVTVRNGAVETPFGPVAAPDLGEGAPAELLIRPEGLTLVPDSAGIAEVLASRMLGRVSLIHLRAGGLHLHARVPGRFMPAEGTRLAVRLDHSQAHVYAAEPGNS